MCISFIVYLMLEQKHICCKGRSELIIKVSTTVCTRIQVDLRNNLLET